MLYIKLYLSLCVKHVFFLVPASWLPLLVQQLINIHIWLLQRKRCGSRVGKHLMSICDHQGWVVIPGVSSHSVSVLTKLFLGLRLGDQSNTMAQSKKDFCFWGKSVP